MIAFNLVMFAFLLINGVLGRNNGRGSARYKQVDEEYNFNHPPGPESYEAIPVAVVYEDEGNREEKTIKSDISQANKVEQVNKGLTSKKPNVTSEGYNDIIDLKSAEEKSNNPASNDNGQVEPQPNLTTSSEQGLQIQVAVVYEPESPYFKTTRPIRKKISNKRRKIYRPPSEEKQVAAKEAINISVTKTDYRHDSPITNHYEDISQPQQFSRRGEQNYSSETNQTQEFSRPGVLSSSESNQPKQFFRRGEPSSSENSQPQEVSRRGEPSSSENSQLQQVSRRGEPSSSESSQPQQVPRRGESSSSESSQPQQVPRRGEPSSSESSQPQQVSRHGKPSSSESSQPQQVSRGGESSSSESSQPQQVFRRGEESRPESIHPQPFSKRDNSTRQRKVVPIVQSENRVFAHSGDFQYSYEGGDGTKAFEKGQLKTYEDDNAGEAVSGGFSYTAKDGNEYSLSYTADENGYRPVGAHLPTPPPIPPAIARALAYLATKTTPEPVTESIKESDY